MFTRCVLIAAIAITGACAGPAAKSAAALYVAGGQSKATDVRVKFCRFFAFYTVTPQTERSRGRVGHKLRASFFSRLTRRWRLTERGRTAREGVNDSIHFISTNQIRGNEAAPAKPERPLQERFPHAVLFGGTCGGTIISDTWVLTAGHCTLFTSGSYVLAGTNNTADGSGVRAPVKRLVVHPRFSVGHYWLDAQQFNLSEVSFYIHFIVTRKRSVTSQVAH
ncbi:Scolexin B [Eumeta japonica]|uniref:Scolexin B n=1 Tax=Eumeta variegata TaxID=151549 RepID=A0A4C1ZKN9_EUMVA|nr:Scolexin B [Eumeta japonica]